jgi:hypothetical protein
VNAERQRFVRESLTVELCATFATADSPPGPGRDDSSLFWRHPRGRHRFAVPLKSPRIVAVGSCRA